MGHFLSIGHLPIITGGEKPTKNSFKIYWSITSKFLTQNFVYFLIWKIKQSREVESTFERAKLNLNKLNLDVVVAARTVWRKGKRGPQYCPQVPHDWPSRSVS